MSDFKVLKTEADIDVYPDQTNVTVTLTMGTGNVFRIQTDADGKHSTERGCLSWLNDDEDFDRYENSEFSLAVAKKEKYNESRILQRA